MDKAAEVLVRSIQTSDAPRIVLLSSQLGYNRPEHAVVQWIERLAMRTAEQAAFVACAESEICGWIEVSVQYRIQSEPFALIGGLVVDQNLRGRGIGRRLCIRAEQWSREHELPMIRVTSRATRANAHRFYIRSGFQATKTSEVFEKNLSV